MSKKARQRRAPSSTKPAPARRRAEASVDTLLDDALSGLWSAIVAGDLLQAELETATLMALARVTGGMDPEDSEEFVSTVVVNVGSSRPTPEGAAFLRVLISLGSPVVKRAASDALAELTDDGIYPPEWAAGAGKAVPGEAWRRYDVFGDYEAVVVTFGYGETKHAILVQVDLTGIPVVIQIAVVEDAEGLIQAIRGEGDPFDRAEQISLAEARRRLEAPLARLDQGLDPDVGAQATAGLPLARSRIRRLPADAPPPRTFTAADRAAVVDDFLSSPQAAEAGTAQDAGSVRFWAEILAGYSGLVQGEPPTRIGPHRLSAIFLFHVPSTFTVSPAQREHMEPAVTAWARWATARQGLDEAATAHLMGHLPKVLADFDAAYDDPEYSVMRGYLTDLAASDADVSWLGDSLARRGFTVPFPAERAGDDRTALLDASDPAHRGALAREEFTGCTPPDGMTSEQFVTAAHRVIEELWHDDPPSTWQAAQRMLAAGSSRHEIIHALAER